jgi:hypothetical protein
MYASQNKVGVTVYFPIKEFRKLESKRRIGVSKSDYYYGLISKGMIDESKEGVI